MAADSLLVDPERAMVYERATGILVRARLDDRFGNWDIAQLDRASLLAWLQSRGGENAWAENTVLVLLGHEQETQP